MGRSATFAVRGSQCTLCMEQREIIPLFSLLLQTKPWEMAWVKYCQCPLSLHIPGKNVQGCSGIEGRLAPSSILIHFILKAIIFFLGGEKGSEQISNLPKDMLW